MHRIVRHYRDRPRLYLETLFWRYFGLLVGSASSSKTSADIKLIFTASTREYVDAIKYVLLYGSTVRLTSVKSVNLDPQLEAAKLFSKKKV